MLELAPAGTTEIVNRELSSLDARVRKIELRLAEDLDLDARRIVARRARKMISAVCAGCGVVQEDVLKPNRIRGVADVRHLLAYLLIEELRCDRRLTEQLLCLRPKSTYYMTERVKERMEVEPEFRKAVEKWTEKVRTA